MIYYGGVMNFLMESFRVPIKRRIVFSAGLIVALLLIGLGTATPGGFYIVKLMDDYAVSWNRILAVLFMLATLAVYGKKAKFVFMTRRRMHRRVT